MIIISSGFPKSASTLLFLYTESLILTSGRSRGQKLFRRFNREGFTPHFGIINTGWYFFSALFGPLVIKTHAGPTFFVRLLLRMRLAKAYYSIRDPRDAILSAMDHGRKAREKGIKTDSDVAFAPLENHEDAFPAFRMHFERYEAWKKYGDYLQLRYEDVVLHPAEALKQVRSFTGLKITEMDIYKTVEVFAKSKGETKNYNKGLALRFKDELNIDEIADLEKELRTCIVSMGYKLTTEQ